MKRVTRFDTITVMVAAYHTTTTGKRRYANIKEGQIVSFENHRKPPQWMTDELWDKVEMTVAQFLRDFPDK